MASQVQIPFEGVILQEHSAPISCPTPNFAKGSRDKSIEAPGAVADTDHFNSVRDDPIQDQITTDGKESAFFSDLRSGNSNLWILG